MAEPYQEKKKSPTTGRPWGFTAIRSLTEAARLSDMPNGTPSACFPIERRGEDRRWSWRCATFKRADHLERARPRDHTPRRVSSTPATRRSARPSPSLRVAHTLASAHRLVNTFHDIPFTTGAGATRRFLFDRKYRTSPSRYRSRRVSAGAATSPIPPIALVTLSRAIRGTWQTPEPPPPNCGLRRYSARSACASS